jgi:hypothetical protein
MAREVHRATSRDLWRGDDGVSDSQRLEWCPAGKPARIREPLLPWIWERLLPGYVAGEISDLALDLFYEKETIMRLSIKNALTGCLIAGALALSAAGAEALGGNANGPDAYIGIIGGSPQQYNYSATGTVNGGYEANVDHGYRNNGGSAHYNGGYHTGY